MSTLHTESESNRQRQTYIPICACVFACMYMRRHVRWVRMYFTHASPPCRKETPTLSSKDGQNMSGRNSGASANGFHVFPCDLLWRLCLCFARGQMKIYVRPRLTINERYCRTAGASIVTMSSWSYSIRHMPEKPTSKTYVGF